MSQCYIMSLIFTLSGYSNSLSTDFYPPIELDGQYNLALLGFYTYNSIWNIDNTNNRFHCKLKDGKEIIIAIPCGAYEITDIEKQVRNQVLEEVKVKNEKEKIDFTPQDSIGRAIRVESNLVIGSYNEN